MPDTWDSHEGQTQYDTKALNKHIVHKEHYDAHVTEPVYTAPLEAMPIEPAQKPSIGRIVHDVLSSGRSKGEHRPGILVRVWSDTCVQLQVFTDSGNDFSHDQQGYDGLFWATSVAYDESEKKQGTWHWPEKV